MVVGFGKALTEMAKTRLVSKIQKIGEHEEICEHIFTFIGDGTMTARRWFLVVNQRYPAWHWEYRGLPDARITLDVKRSDVLLKGLVR